MVNSTGAYYMRWVLVCTVLALAGCATKPVPVAWHCASIQLPPDLVLATRGLSEASTPRDVAVAYRADLGACVVRQRIIQQQVKSS